MLQLQDNARDRRAEYPFKRIIFSTGFSIASFLPCDLARGSGSISGALIDPNVQSSGTRDQPDVNREAELESAIPRCLQRFVRRRNGHNSKPIYQLSLPIGISHSHNSRAAPGSPTHIKSFPHAIFETHTIRITDLRWQ